MNTLSLPLLFIVTGLITFIFGCLYWGGGSFLGRADSGSDSMIFFFICLECSSLFFSSRFDSFFCVYAFHWWSVIFGLLTFFPLTYNSTASKMLPRISSSSSELRLSPDGFESVPSSLSSPSGSSGSTSNFPSSYSTYISFIRLFHENWFSSSSFSSWMILESRVLSP